jgi:hypothetical protein
LPASQDVQLAALFPEKVPFEQISQEEAPLYAENLPPEQVSQLTAPAVEYLPAKQSKQTLDPAFNAYLPGSHELHED